jgi:pimeloyl-ACP methyl ester carboxylesterase
VLAVAEGGDPNGVPVVVHHGTPGSGIHYSPLVEDAEAKGIRLIGYDRPGYGGSTRLRGRDVAACAADVAAICDALGIDRFCTWGISGGGPHALATAALLPGRVAAAGALAPVAPYDADGLDFFAGMGEQNIEEFGHVLEGDEPHLAALERDRAELLRITPDQLVEAWTTLLGPSDRAVLKGSLAEDVLEATRVGIEPSGDGWFDDDVAFTRPWGFDLASIRVPVQHWQGEQDKFVPFGHGVWLAEHIPGVESHLTSEDGHLTLAEHRVPEMHAWLLERV